MDVTFSTDRGSVAQTSGHALNGRAQVSLYLRSAIEAFHLPESERRQYRSCPGAKILGRDVMSGDFLQVGVDVVGGDVLPLPIPVEVLQELLSGQFLACLDDLRHAAILYFKRPLFPALTGKAKPDLRPRYSNMAVHERG